MPCLTKLSVCKVHIGAFGHMRPINPSLDCWTHIESVELRLYEASLRQDQTSGGQLQTIRQYIQCFENVKRLRFGWVGHRGPPPTAKERSDRQVAEMLMNTVPHPLYRSTKTEQHAEDITSSNLTHLSLSNVEASAAALSYLLESHALTLHDLHLDAVKLSSGTWDQALAPLVSFAKTNGWQKQVQETWDVPIMLGSDIVARQPTTVPARRQRHNPGIQMGTASLASSLMPKSQHETTAHRTFSQSDRQDDGTRHSPTERSDQRAAKQCRFELPPDKPPTPPPKGKKRSLWSYKQPKKIFRGGLLKWP